MGRLQKVRTCFFEVNERGTPYHLDDQLQREKAREENVTPLQFPLEYSAVVALNSVITLSIERHYHHIE